MLEIRGGASIIEVKSVELECGIFLHICVFGQSICMCKIYLKSGLFLTPVSVVVFASQADQ